MNRTPLRQYAAPAALALSLSLGAAACGGQDPEPTDSGNGGNSDGGSDSVSGSIKIDGSSTVEPLSSAANQLFTDENPDVRVTVGASGTGGGFEVFCAGRTDISDASRPIDPEEEKLCQENSVEFTELRVATDALTVVTNPSVDWTDCITTEQLNTIWAPDAEGKIESWSDVDPSWPDTELALFGPGTDSGTFDYFTDEINGEEGVSRSDYEASEDDNVLVEGVANTEGAMGYFGFTFYKENADTLKALQIDSGDGCVEPSAETAQSGEYTPLARPLFIYVSNKAYQEKPQVAAFVDFYVEQLDQIVEAAEYIQLNEDQKAELEEPLASLSG